jgi:hypothetical protein
MPFDANDQDAIAAALADPDPNNPIAKAIAERIKKLTVSYWTQAEKQGRVPTELMLIKPRTILDDVAIRLALQEIADVTEQTVTIVWVPEDDGK